MFRIREKHWRCFYIIFFLCYDFRAVEEYSNQSQNRINCDDNVDDCHQKQQLMKKQKDNNSYYKAKFFNFFLRKNSPIIETETEKYYVGK